MRAASRSRIAIIGGGIAGVSTAYELSRNGHADFVLYEASARLGGIVETVHQDGFVIECGPDSWVTEKPWARDLALELGLEAEILASNDAIRRTYLLLNGELTPMPDSMRMMVPTDLEDIERSPLFSEAAKQAYRLEALRAAEFKASAAARPSLEDESVACFVERHFGSEVTEKVAGPLLSGVFGGDIRQLSASAVMAPFVKMEQEYGSLVVALQKQRSQKRQSSAVFTTLKSGLQTLVERMTAVIPPSNLRLSEPVSEMNWSRGEWEVATRSGLACFDRVVLATPVHISRRLVARWNSELGSLLDIEATSAVVVAFAFSPELASSVQTPKGFGFLVPQSQNELIGQEPELLAATFVDQKFSHRVPEGGMLIRAFYGGESAPKLLDEDDSSILKLSHRRLSHILGELPEPSIALVRRWPRSLPQYTIGHRRRVGRIEEISREIPGFYLVGNAFHGVGLPDLVRQGRALANSLLAS
ncbi:Protoporphyrinogen IX oxidase, aerobic, HemY [Acidisarcina polymorpha]|uniref:Coproporphyrinogen III oxidase n=1 Tax=Acidisarcina polymorpha TaxID=2211140 RepID=A0A2Z5G1H7_9BACT|nr:protoporphyrinogen oxidase [Acidisarcina polymorpha]AXC12951.1 Protoporphyrinogen IX oxidase, aerobic, HemY [Acidisarcina polymorpha]